jgi:predicted nucleic acid-binding Zn ribbon protein
VKDAELRLEIVRLEKTGARLALDDERAALFDPEASSTSTSNVNVSCEKPSVFSTTFSTATLRAPAMRALRNFSIALRTSADTWPTMSRARHPGTRAPSTRPLADRLAEAPLSGRPR